MIAVMVADWVDLVQFLCLIGALIAFLGLVGMACLVAYRGLVEDLPVPARRNGGDENEDDDGTAGVTAPLKPKSPTLSGSASRSVDDCHRDNDGESTNSREP
jgi:hypothetical protein